MCVGFVLLAFSTALDVAADKGDKTRPPELSSNQLAGFKETGVTSRFVIVASFKNGTVEGVIGGNVDVTFVGEDSSFDLPVSETRAEGERNIFMHELKCL